MDSIELVDEHVLRKYQVLQKLGKGAYAVVFKAVDKKHKCEFDPNKKNPPCKKTQKNCPCPKSIVAIKKIFDAFQNETDAQRTFREIMYLQAMTSHENIIRLQNVLKAKNNLDMYLVFDYMETDLHSVIRANILEPVHKEFIIYQLLKALKYCHSGDLVHRDLKPSNLLLDEECHLKVADFGLARSLKALKCGDDQMSILTDYVATRWYRAPEILFGSTQYTKAVDMWAVGCIAAEMYMGKALLPGCSTMNQLELVLNLTGQPTKEDLASMNSKYVGTMLKALPSPKPVYLAKIMQDAPPQAVDLVGKLMCFNPEKRLVAHVDNSLEQHPPGLSETNRLAQEDQLDAFNHPFVASFARGPDGRRLNTEKICPGKLEVPADRTDDVKFTVQQYRDDLYKQVVNMKKDRKARENLYFRLRGRVGGH